MIKNIFSTPLARLLLFVALFFGFVFYASFISYNEKKLTTDKQNNVQKLQKALVTKHTSPVLVTKPKPKPVNLAIDLSAKSALIADINGKIFYSKNLHTKLPPASTTKIMTAVVALENYDLNDVVEVPYYCTTVSTQKVGFVVGEKLTVRSLITSMLIFSGADAACILQYKNNEPQIFLQQMNDKAKELKLKDTNFSNVIGYDEPDHYLSAIDMYTLAKYAMNIPEFARNVSLKETVIVSVDGANVHNIKNTNELLFTHDNVLGVKTGFTDFARDCLVFEYKLNGKKFLGVILGSENRFEDADKMISATSNYLSTLSSSAGK